MRRVKVVTEELYGHEYSPATIRRLVQQLDEELEKFARRLVSRLVASRVRPAHRDSWRSEPHQELWMVAEWPRGAAEPTK